MAQPSVQLASIDEEKSLSQHKQQDIKINVASQTHTKPCPDLLNGPRKDYITTGIPLYEASIKGDWKAAKAILDKRLELVRYSITENGETALHVAASAKSTKQVEDFVENLIEYMEKTDLELENNSSNTALCLAAAAGNVKMVKIMVKKNKALVAITGSQQMTPLYMAALFGHYEVVKFLYDNSQNLHDDCWTPQNRGWLLLKCVETDMFDIALRIVQEHPDLRSSGSVLGVLAKKADIFAETESNIFKKTFNWVINPKKQVLERESKAKALELLTLIWENISEKPRNEIDAIIRGPPDPPVKPDDKSPSDKEEQTFELLKRISDGIDKMPFEIRNLIKDSPPVIRPNVQIRGNPTKKYSARIIFVAAEMGNTRFIIELIRKYPDLIWKVNDNNQSIFHTAVKHRHEGIYNLLYEIGSMKDLITPLKDKNDNNMLHLVGKSAKKKRLEDVSGVALQMQRELLWFKEVENMIPPSYRERRNKEGLTPHELFTREHKELVKQGEDWMKDTASQCMVVAALIATIVFAAAFTVPGGYNQDDGIPYFKRKGTFIAFVVSDAVSLFSSSASILMFLSILTSRYAERDFLESLPKKLMIGDLLNNAFLLERQYPSSQLHLVVSAKPPCLFILYLLCYLLSKIHTINGLPNLEICSATMAQSLNFFVSSSRSPDFTISTNSYSKPMLQTPNRYLSFTKSPRKPVVLVSASADNGQGGLSAVTADFVSDNGTKPITIAPPDSSSIEVDSVTEAELKENGFRSTRRTKLVCTIGPATCGFEQLEALAVGGMNVARINMCHGTREWHKTVIERVRRLNEEKGYAVAIMMDTEGSEIHMGDLGGASSAKAEDGEVWTFSVRAYDSLRPERSITVNYDGFAEDVKVGDELLVDGGMVRFEVIEKIGPDVKCLCTDPGLLLPRANLTFWRDGSLVRERNAMLPTISSKDWLDIDFGIAEGVDFIAVSFVKSAEVINHLKSYIKARSRDGDIAVLAKIESIDSLKNLKEIIQASDGAMVARGDLGAQIPLEQVPLAQQKIVETCRKLNKPVIVASQLLESMIEYPTPTRAEVADVSEAVRQRADALMLSGESAMGQFPDKALTVLRSVSLRIEKWWREEKRHEVMELPDIASSFSDSISEEICNSAAKMANNLEVDALFVYTKDGHMASLLSRSRPDCPIFAFTTDTSVRRRLNLQWGLIPFRLGFSDDMESNLNKTFSLLKARGMIKSGDLVIAVSDMLQSIQVMNVP